MKRAAFILICCWAVLATLSVARADGPVAATSAPTFTKDVAPILYKNCVSCHRPGEIAPMSLLTYQDARPWAKAIRAQVVARVMPPWGADPQHGRFRNDRSLSEANIATIASWVERALEAAERHEEAKLEEGVQLVHRAFADVLRREGLEDIPTEGRFDPHVHEALLSQPSEADEGTVIEVIQKGYRLGDRVLRPARVVVAAPIPPADGGDG